jgi:hypothetical protein
MTLRQESFIASPELSPELSPGIIPGGRSQEEHQTREAHRGKDETAPIYTAGRSGRAASRASVFGHGRILGTAGGRVKWAGRTWGTVPGSCRFSGILWFPG